MAVSGLYFYVIEDYHIDSLLDCKYLEIIYCLLDAMINHF